MKQDSKIRSYKDLVVWQKGMELVSRIYLITKRFPASEQFGLTSQIQRAAVSIPANIAEGYGRNTKNEYANFLRIARGSLTELETLLLIAKQQSYCGESDFTAVEVMLKELGAMLYRLRERIVDSA